MSQQLSYLVPGYAVLLGSPPDWRPGTVNLKWGPRYPSAGGSSTYRYPGTRVALWLTNTKYIF
eukprot:2800164-Rhodomonas_salina.2